MPEPPDRHYSGSARGEFFVQGDVYARNINLITRPARSTYRRLTESPNILGSLHAKIQEHTERIIGLASITEEYSAEGKLDTETKARFEEVAKNCRSSLGKLQELSRDFEVWSTQSVQEQEVEQIAYLLEKQINHLTEINKTVWESVVQLESLIKQYVAEVKSGTRASSIRTNISTKTVSTMTRPEWQQLQRELEAIGISSSQFSANESRILQMLQTAFDETSSFDDQRPNISMRSDGSLLPRRIKKTSFFTRMRYSGSGGSKRLIKAIDRKNVSELKSLLELGADPYSFIELGRNPLLYAIELRNVEMVGAILSHSPSLKQIDFKDWADNPICLAFQKRNTGLVKLLLENGANPECYRCKKSIQDQIFKTDEWGDEYAFSIIFESWKRTYPQDLLQNGDWLCSAVKKGALNIVEVLLASGVSVDTGIGEFLEHETPLSLAVMRDDLNMVNLLLQNNATVDSPSVGPNIPLTLAIKRGNQETFQILLDHGANPHSGHRHTPYMHESVGEPWTKSGFDNKSPLMIALELGSSDMVQHMLSYDYPRKLDPCLVKRAIETKQQALVDFLLKKQNLPIVNKVRRLPLCVAVETGDLSIVQLLVDDYNADVNACMPHFEHPEKELVSPLAIAAERNYEQILEFLLEHNVNIHRPSLTAFCSKHKHDCCMFFDHGLLTCNATQIAAAHNNLKCAQMLKARGGRLNDTIYDGPTNIGHLLNICDRRKKRFFDVVWAYDILKTLDVT